MVLILTVALDHSPSLSFRNGRQKTISTIQYVGDSSQGTPLVFAQACSILDASLPLHTIKTLGRYAFQLTVITPALDQRFKLSATAPDRLSLGNWMQAFTDVGTRVVVPSEMKMKDKYVPCTRMVWSIVSTNFGPLIPRRPSQDEECGEWLLKLIFVAL